MFALAVAVCPDHELVRVAGLRLEVPDEILRSPWVVNHSWRIKQLEWVACVPRLELGRKVELCEMAGDIGDDKCCTCFRIVESVVFYCWYMRIDLRIPAQKMSVYGQGGTRSELLTVSYSPPERICVIDLAIDDFSATHSTIIPTYRSNASSCFKLVSSKSHKAHISKVATPMMKHHDGILEYSQPTIIL